MSVAAAVVSSLSICVLALKLWGSDGYSAEGTAHIEVVEGREDAVGDQLHDAQLLRSRRAFAAYRKLFANDFQIEPGAHILPRGASPKQLLSLLARRQDRAVRSVTLPEGWDLFQIADRLEQQEICTVQAFVAAARDATGAQQVVRVNSFEGYLYPATYSFRLNSDPTRLVQRMGRESMTRFAKVFAAMRSHFAQLSVTLTEYEIIKLASIVHKEAADSGEFGRIARVFLNRLADPDFRPRRMLQSDPTAAYGCKLGEPAPSCASFSGMITPVMLRDSANRYNSYRHAGLPPTPIGNPSVASVEAVQGALSTQIQFSVHHIHRFSVLRKAHLLQGRC